MALSYNWKRVLAEVGVEKMLKAIAGLPSHLLLGLRNAVSKLTTALRTIQKIVHRAAAGQNKFWERPQNRSPLLKEALNQPI